MRGEIVRAFVIAGLVALVCVALASAAAPADYKGQAKRLVPSAVEAGYARVVQQSNKPLAAHVKPGLLSSWTAEYASGDAMLGGEVVSAMVFRSDSTAAVQYGAACTTGCDAMRFNGWRFKRKFELAPSGNDRIVTLVAQCRNLVVAATRSALDNKDHLTVRLKITLDAVFARAATFGMTACGSSTPLPPTGSYYWTESHAEAAALQSIKVPYCKVEPTDPDCAGQAGYGLQTADCRGSDEHGTSFTYSRFSCHVVAGYVSRQSGLEVILGTGTIAIYPTGPSAFRWAIVSWSSG